MLFGTGATNSYRRVGNRAAWYFGLVEKGVKHKVLVANIADGMILGMDGMSKHGFKLDLKEEILLVEN